MSFWEPHYLPSKDNHTDPNNPIPNHPSHLTHQLNEIPPNVQKLSNGKFRAYKSQNANRVYLGTFNTIDECLEAQMQFTLTGQIPQRQRLRKNMELTELIALFLEINGEYN